MVRTLEKVYFRRVGAAALFATIVIAVMIIGGMAATIVIFAPGANAAPPDRVGAFENSETINPERWKSI